jgi:hypothetical protein
MQYYMIEIEVEPGVWKRVGRPYRLAKTARSWLSFVRSAWHAKYARVTRFERDPPTPAGEPGGPAGGR